MRFWSQNDSNISLYKHWDQLMLLFLICATHSTFCLWSWIPQRRFPIAYMCSWCDLMMCLNIKAHKCVFSSVLQVTCPVSRTVTIHNPPHLVLAVSFPTSWPTCWQSTVGSHHVCRVLSFMLRLDTPACVFEQNLAMCDKGRWDALHCA